MWDFIGYKPVNSIQFRKLVQIALGNPVARVGSQIGDTLWIGLCTVQDARQTYYDIVDII